MEEKSGNVTDWWWIKGKNRMTDSDSEGSRNFTDEKKKNYVKDILWHL